MDARSRFKTILADLVQTTWFDAPEGEIILIFRHDPNEPVSVMLGDSPCLLASPSFRSAEACEAAYESFAAHPTDAKKKTQKKKLSVVDERPQPVE